MSDGERNLLCPLCGQEHHPVALRRGDRAICVRCGALMMSRGFLGADAALAFSITGLLLSVPAAWLPWVTLSTLGDARATSLLGAVEGFWQYDMHALAALVLVCGALAPVLLLVLLTSVLLSARLNPQRAVPHMVGRVARAVQAWAMPEVQILGVLVAFFKLGDVATISVGPGLWLYAAISFSVIIAWRSFGFQEMSLARNPATSAQS